MEKIKCSGFIFTVLLCVFLSGCIISHHSHSINASSDFPQRKTILDDIEPGVTTKQWLLDNLGKPTREKKLQDSEELLIYENKKKTSHHFSLFLIFSTHSSEESKEAITFRINSGIVQSYWFDC